MYTDFNNSFTVVFSDLLLNKVVGIETTTSRLLLHYLATLELQHIKLSMLQ